VLRSGKVDLTALGIFHYPNPAAHSTRRPRLGGGHVLLELRGGRARHRRANQPGAARRRRRAYVDAYVDCVLNTSIHKQARAGRPLGGERASAARLVHGVRVSKPARCLLL